MMFQDMFLIKLENLTKTYRMGDETVNAISGINLEISTGEFVAVIGPSGSGKSTLLHIIGGLDSPTSGSVTVDGQDLSRADDRKLANYRNHSIGFVFQSFHLHPNYDSLDNVAMPLIFAKIAAGQRKKMAIQALSEVDLLKRAHHRPNELSGGERQRVSIARALVTNPKILLADEPTGNLDTKTGSHIIDMLTKLNFERGLTLIMVTHNLEIAQRANRIIFMADGHITEERQRL
jgi:putative ABC transport system ATP-binding protein